MNHRGEHAIFNSAGSLPNIIGTFAQKRVFIRKWLSVYFPSLTNQGLSLYRGTTVTTHTAACWVSLESEGEEGGGLASPVVHIGFCDSYRPSGSKKPNKFCGSPIINVRFDLIFFIKFKFRNWKRCTNRSVYIKKSIRAT